MNVHSRVEHVGSWHDFPLHTGTRIMMMPVLLEDPSSLPVKEWRSTFAHMVSLAPVKRGVGYLTIDEASVPAGQCHRRPGLHVDGLGGWGGPSPWASSGMLVWGSVRGARAWRGTLDGVEFDQDGGCEDIRERLGELEEVPMLAGIVYRCGPWTIHEGVPMRVDSYRSWVRLSMPSDAPWFEGYSRNPLGILPAGPIMPARFRQMNYRR